LNVGKLCPGCGDLYLGTSCPRGCRPGGKRTTPGRAVNRKVWTSSAHARQRLRVFRRDRYTCVDCGHRDDTETGEGLVADHVAGIDAVRAFADHELATRCASCSGRKDGRRGNARR
jgi:5-methylcytosine-specific restriction endonuclease McrA